MVVDGRSIRIVLSLVVLKVIGAAPLVQLAGDGVNLRRVQASLHILNIFKDILLLHVLVEITLALALANMRQHLPHFILNKIRYF